MLQVYLQSRTLRFERSLAEPFSLAKKFNVEIKKRLNFPSEVSSALRTVDSQIYRLDLENFKYKKVQNSQNVTGLPAKSNFEIRGNVS